MDYPIVITSLSDDDGGGYIGYAVDLQGCMSDGATQEKALASTKKAIREWIAESRKLGRTIPEPGSGARRVAKEKDALVRALKAFTKQHSEIENRIENLEIHINELLEKVEAIDAWTRFAALTGLEVSQDQEVGSEGRC